MSLLLGDTILQCNSYTGHFVQSCSNQKRKQLTWLPVEMAPAMRGIVVAVMPGREE